MYSFCCKTGDVTYDRDILKKLKAERLLRIRDGEILDYLSCDIEVLRRRNLIFSDTLRTDGMYELMENLVKNLSYIYDITKSQSSFGDNERGLYSVKELLLYFEVIDKMYAFRRSCMTRLDSPDYIELFDEIESIAVSEEYTRIKENTSKLLDVIAHIKSVSVGFNLNEQLEPYEAGILSVNDEFIESGKLIDKIMRFDMKNDNTSIAPLVFTSKQCKFTEYTALNFAMYSALNKIFRKLIREWEPEIDKYIKNKLGFLIEALPDFQFIMTMTRIQRMLIDRGLKLSKTVYRDKNEKTYDARGIYNPVLALELKEQNKKIVKNNIRFDPEGTVYILTGPNNGGKSEFIAANCFITLMAQMGMMVPADSFILSPVDSIWFVVSQNKALNQSGRLAEECVNISEAFKQITPHALYFFDETFASTDASEATALSVEVLHALAYLGVRSIFNTHFHQLTHYADEINNSGDIKGNVDFLVAGVKDDETRTYIINRTDPEGKSYAKTIAEKYGIRYDELLAKSKSPETEKK